MKIYNDLNQLNICRKTSVALGNFDGLHVGHRKIMEKAIDSADKNDFESLCFTFSNHPINFILGRTDDDPAAVSRICSESEKIRLIEEMGFDILVNIPFDEEIVSMSADDFFDGIIIGKLNAGSVSVGFNYSYGARASGSSESLREKCKQTGIGINIHEAVKIDGEIVSSTLIREMIREGNMEALTKYLGRPLSYSGRVTHGRKLGSSKGFPTANITPRSGIALPPNGVYFSRIIADEKAYNGISNIGVKPTVNNTAGSEAEISIESYLFEYDGDLYGKEIKILLDHYSREERKFDSKDKLFEQIAIDCREAALYRKK